MNPYSPPEEYESRDAPKGNAKLPASNRIGRLIVVLFVMFFGGLVGAYVILWTTILF